MAELEDGPKKTNIKSAVFLGRVIQLSEPHILCV